MIVLVDTKFIGKKYGPVAYEIGKEKCKEFARSVGDENPRYMDDAADGGIVAPPMFAVVYARDIAADMLLDKELALNLMMLVHGEQAFEFGELARPGDVITTVGELASIAQKGKNDIVTLQSVSRNQNGEITATGKWTFVIRGM